MSSLNDVKVQIPVVLGRSVIPMHQLLRMGRGAVIELSANNRAIAKGEIVIEGDRVAVSISEVLKTYGPNTTFV
jgi:flagellar motor switch protein FliN/FliY